MLFTVTCPKEEEEVVMVSEPPAEEKPDGRYAPEAGVSSI